MEHKKIVDNSKIEMDKVINYYSDELKRIRADRATPSLIEDVVISCFNQKLPLKQLASISCPEQRQLLIQPWDRNYIKDIVGVLQKSESDFGIIIEGNNIRVNLPPLTQEYRQSLLRLLAEKKETARINLRRIREDSWKKVQEKFQNKELNEDDKFEAKEKLQEVIDEYNNKTEELTKRKEEEIIG